MSASASRRQVGVAGDQARPAKHDPLQVRPLQRPERHLVVADQRGDVLAPAERHAELPQDRAGPSGRPAREWPVRGDPAVRLGGCSPAWPRRAAAPRRTGGPARSAGSARQRRQRRPAPRTAMRVWVATSPSAWWTRVLRHPVEPPDPVERGVGSRPSRTVQSGGRGHSRSKSRSAHPNRSTPGRAAGWRRSGRSSQCAAGVEHGRAGSRRGPTCSGSTTPPSSSTLRYSPSISSAGSVSRGACVRVDARPPAPPRAAPRRHPACGRSTARPARSARPACRTRPAPQHRHADDRQCRRAVRAPARRAKERRRSRVSSTSNSQK